MFEAFHIRFTISLKTDARAGHSLIELLVVLAIVALVAVLPATTLGDVLARHDARNSAQRWQLAIAWAEIASARRGERLVLVSRGSELRLSGATGRVGELTAGSRDEACATNVRRWRSPSGVTIGFVAPFGSPDAAGSLYLGAPGSGSRVVVRAESGLTRRETW